MLFDVKFLRIVPLRAILLMIIIILLIKVITLSRLLFTFINQKPIFYNLTYLQHSTIIKNSTNSFISHHFIYKSELIFFACFQHYQMWRQDYQAKPDKFEVLRIFLIGLPYSGVKEVAKVLASEYDCKIYQAKLQDKPNSQSIKKYIRQICYQQFRQTTRAVLLTTVYKQDILLELKKRNYLNVVYVDATFKKRYENYLLDDRYQDSLESIKEFMEIDQATHNEDFQRCLEFVRVRVMNSGSLQKLKEEIQKKEKDIIRFFRPTWDQYFMKIADIARRRSNCMKTSVGAVIVNDQNRVVSTGYNGTPKGIPSCYKLGCDRCNNNEGKQLDQCLCLHAQQSAIIEVGINKTQNCTLYTTYYPCFSCAKIIKQAGIKKIFYMDEYEKQDSGKPFIQEYFNAGDVVKINADNLYY